MFENKVLLVTGAAGVIGGVTVRQALAAGARVLATDALDSSDGRASGVIDTLGDRGRYVQCDITDSASVERLVDVAVTELGGLHAAANMAGIVGSSVRTADFDEPEWRKIVEINLVGTWLCLKYEIRAMLAGGDGAIVNIASVAGHSGEIFRSPYVASKAGIIGLTKAAAVEYAQHGIRVNCISPGPIDTPMFHVNNGGPGSPAYERVARAQPVRRMGRPEEIAAATLWLLSPQASFVVGHELVADGGLTAEGVAVDEGLREAAPVTSGAVS
jgi:NAD(P)-dependent dehydrogenase (short-subunit alcohol dehydrogenase family)